MCTLNHCVLTVDDERTLLACVSPPQHKDHRLFFLVDQRDDVVRECLPAVSLMTSRFTLTHGESGVQHEHTLFSPMCEVPVRRNVRANVVVEFGEDVSQRRWESHPVLNRETEAVRLASTVVRILA